MNILYDITPVYATRGGNHTYSKELYATLSASYDLSLHSFAYTRKPSNYKGFLRKFNAAYRDLIHFPVVGGIRSAGVDIVHSTGSPVISHAAGDKHVITVHDLAILDTPERFTSWSKFYFEKIFLPSLKNCRAIITNSRFTDSRLRALFPELAEKSIVTPLASKDFSEVIAEPIEGVEEEFYLFVGSSDPAKNYKLLLESYAEAGSRGLKLPKTAVVGTFNFGVGDERAANSNIVELGGVSDGQLKWLYEHCLAFLFPSYYEGFGLPILEAMSCGSPVICGRVCSLPEVAGDAACYSKLAGESFYESMRRLYEDIEYRELLANKGKDRVKGFDWHQTAGLTYEVYQSVID